MGVVAVAPDQKGMHATATLRYSHTGPRGDTEPVQGWATLATIAPNPVVTAALPARRPVRRRQSG